MEAHAARRLHSYHCERRRRCCCRHARLASANLNHTNHPCMHTHDTQHLRSLSSGMAVHVMRPVISALALGPSAHNLLHASSTAHALSACAWRACRCRMAVGMTPVPGGVCLLPKDAVAYPVGRSLAIYWWVHACVLGRRAGGACVADHLPMRLCSACRGHANACATVHQRSCRSSCSLGQCTIVA